MLLKRDWGACLGDGIHAEDVADVFETDRCPFVLEWVPVSVINQLAGPQQTLDA